MNSVKSNSILLTDCDSHIILAADEIAKISRKSCEMPLFLHMPRARIIVKSVHIIGRFLVSSFADLFALVREYCDFHFAM